MDDAVESSMGDAVDDARASPMVDAIASSMDEPTDENHGTMPRRRLWTMPFRVAMDHGRRHRRTMAWTISFRFVYGAVDGVVHAMVRL